MLREEIVFGPIRSRRLGSSLGINLLPERGKLCNFDCVYCECGWNADGRGDKSIPGEAALRVALEGKLQKCAESGVEIDSITFSGDGEPTLNPEFPAIIDTTLELRDRYYPEAKVSVLTNATRLDAPGVFEALRKVDNPVLKLDAPATELVQVINRPQGAYQVLDVVSSMERFNGDFVLQTMFLRMPGFDWDAPGILDAWMDIVRHLHPRQVMAYTIDRPTPMPGLAKISPEELEAMLRPLIDEGFKVDIYG